MIDKEIIDYWKQGYTVEQIVNMHPIVKKTKENENVVKIIQHRIEKTILKYQS